MLTCSKCGTENPLGRVFCVKCGAKLDLGRVTKESIDSQVNRNWFAEHGKTLAWVIIVILLIPVALALWPQTRPLAAAGQKQDERYVDGCLKQMARLKQGQIMPNVQFTDAQVNALFAESRSKEWKVDMVSFAFDRGYFSVRMVSPLLGPWTVKGYQIGLKISRDITCVPMGGSRIEVRKGAIGHLPLPGPMVSLALNPILKKARADADWAGISKASEIKCEQGKLTVTVKP